MFHRIFEEFAFYMLKEACEKRATKLMDLPRKKYAFDSTTIPLCLATFPWTKFRRKKGDVKAHVLYDIEAQVPAIYTLHITVFSTSHPDLVGGSAFGFDA